MNAITYITKQMTTQAWYRRGLIRQGGGPILGKRASCTQNIASWQAAHRPALLASPREEAA